MAWKLLALTTILLTSLTDCKPAQKMTILSVEPSITFTPPVQPSTPPKTTSITVTPTALAPTELPQPSASPMPKPIVSTPSKKLPKPTNTPFTAATQTTQVTRFRDPSPVSLPAGLACIRHLESTDNYTAHSPYGDWGGYEYKNSTWDGYRGYAQADLAPPAVQDARALADYNLGAAVRHQLWPVTSRLCGV